MSLKSPTRHWKKGSVLLLVIVLLLLLSILGTAFISTSHTDRINSQQTLLNVQSEANFDGLTKTVGGLLAEDVNDPLANFRGTVNTVYPNYAGQWSATTVYSQYQIVNDPTNPANYYEYTNTTATAGNPLTNTTYWTAFPFPGTPRSEYRGTYDPNATYNIGDVVSTGTPPQYWVYPAPPLPAPAGPPPGNWILSTNIPVTSSGAQPWLAERTPLVATPTAVLSATNQPYWPNISHSGTIGSTTSILGLPFESPDGSTMVSSAVNTPRYPGFATLNGVTVPTLSDALAPVWPPTVTMPVILPVAPNPHIVIAADADGDGIADSLLFRIPGANYDGLTWYAGVRIIDNNSAVNVNTAWSRDQDYDFANNALPNWGFFPSNTGLLEMLDPAGPSPDALTTATPNNIRLNFNQYRFNSNIGTATYPLAGQTPWDETGVVPPSTPLTVNTAQTVRTDFNYLTQGDAFANQFVRRIDNPGYNSDPSSKLRYQQIPSGDEADLAYHFVLPNANSGPTLLEGLLPTSLTEYENNRGGLTIPGVAFGSANPTALPTTPYGANPLTDVSAWWYENFDFDNGGAPAPNYMPIRSLVTVRNPVTNYIAPVYDSSSNTNPQQPINTLAGAANTTVVNSGQTEVVTGQTMLPYYTPPVTNGQMRGGYINGATYYAHDVVQFWGYYFINIAGTNAAAPATPYFNASGAFLGFSAYNTAEWGTWGQFKGAWNANLEYRFNDLVTATDPATGDACTYISVNDDNLGNNPTTQIPFGSANQGTLLNYQFWQRQPYSRHPVKANVNTATFRELYRAFWSAMAGNPSSQTVFGTTYVDYNPYDDTGGAATQPTGAAATQPYSNPGNPLHQFRSPLRDPTPSVGTANVTQITPGNMLLLRAAIAAVNTLGLRDQSQNVISRTVWITANINSGAGAIATPVEAVVYSNAPQPFITEAYANDYNSTNDPAAPGSTNPAGYVAIELYNPYAVSITMTNWQIATINRSGGPPYPNLQLTSLYTLPTTVIAPNTYVLLENYHFPTATTLPSTQPATYRPQSSGLTPPVSGPWTGGQDIYVPGLENAIISPGAEVVLLRPRRADGTLTSSADPLNTYNEANIWDLVPVDSFDFTGMPTPPPVGSGGTYYFWSYIRGKGPGEVFKQIYPGRYNAIATPRSGDATTAPSPTTQESTNVDTQTGIGAVAFPPPWTPSFGAAIQPSYPNNFPPIQIYNVANITATSGRFTAANYPSGANMHVPNPVVTPNSAGTAVNSPTGQQFPFGTFARNADMLDIPFIGAYRIRQLATITATPQNFVELNSLPMDSSFADDGDPADDGFENIGRFCPLNARSLFPSGFGTTIDYYSWAANLFSYLTVQSNNDDYMPDFDPTNNDITTTGNPNANKYWPAYNVTAPPPVQTPPTPVINADAAVTDQTSQDNVGVNGLININTAGWKVLSMLPMVTYRETGETIAVHPNANAANEALAQAIVAWRNAHGPFLSIFDLNAVTSGATNATTTFPANFQNAYGYINIPAQGTAPALGGPPPYPLYSGNGTLVPADLAFPNISTATPVYPNFTEDFQGDFAVLNRISNLITTRSDTFTVYIVIEGWQNPVLTPLTAGAPLPNPPPALKVIKRYAFIADRSQINSDISTRFLKTLVIPNN